MVSTEVRRKDGTVITIQGTEAEVKRILSVLEANEANKKPRPKKKVVATTSKMTIAEMLHELRDERFFDNPRSLNEIKNALAERGRIYPVTTLSAQVIRLVRKRGLGRIKKEDKWLYVNR